MGSIKIKLRLEKSFRVPLQTIAGVILVLLLSASCKENDDIPPVMTLNGQDTIYHVLNETYKDPGVTAIDDVDGDVSSKVYVDNTGDIDRMGEYDITYKVVDEAGNEAVPLYRKVFVYNEALQFYGNYAANDEEVYPGQSECSYPTFFWVDSTLNNRLVILDFACSSKRSVYADVQDTVLIVPFQLIQDSIVDMALQGAGTINDSMVSLEYTRTEEVLTSYWKVKFTRLK